MFTKPYPIKAPASENVQFLWRDSETSQGKDDSRDATDAPRPKRINKEGRAQHNRVPNEVKREK